MHMGWVRHTAVLSIAILSLMYLYHLGSNMMDYDEGAIYLYPGMLYKMGLKPYVDFSYSQPIFSLFIGNQPTVFVARFVNLIYLLMTSLLVFKVGKKFGVGYFSVVFLLSCPIIMEFGRVAVGDIPLLCFFSLFIVGILERPKNHSLSKEPVFGVLLQMLIGAAAAFAILTKIQIAPVLCVLYAYLFYRREGEYIVSVGVGVYIILVAFLLFPGMTSIFDTGSYDIDRAGSYLITSVVYFLVKGAFLAVFGAYGIVVAFNKRKDRGTMILSVVLLSSFTLFSYSWANYRHLMFLIPVLAVFAGIGLKNLGAKEFMAVVMLAGVFVPVGAWFSTIGEDTQTQDIVKYISNTTTEGGNIYTDQPLLAYLSDRKMPATATMWNGMGRLHGLGADDVIRDISNAKPEEVLIVTSTPLSMDQPRIVSTFGAEGAKRIIDYLDGQYTSKEYLRRDFQLITVWRGPK